MEHALEQAFFSRDTIIVAEQLIGCLLVRKLPGLDRPLIVRINETEAYKGAEDPASHAHRGMTARNRAMFGPPGRLYVYFTYGMHHCMNIVTEQAGVPGAVLLRGAAVLSGIDEIRKLRKVDAKVKDRVLLNGPAKLTQGLAVDLQDNEYDVCSKAPSGNGTGLWILPPDPHHYALPIQRTGRIGISKAQDFPWRFVAILN